MNSTTLIIMGILLLSIAGATLVLLVHHNVKIKPKVEPPSPQASLLPPISGPTVAELEAQLKLAYENQITNASRSFGEDLKATSAKLSDQVVRLSGNVIEEELSAYQKTLEEVRKVATVTMQQIHDAVDGQRVELRLNMEQEVAEERLRLVQQFDTRLGDIVASYVAESLGVGVDLGAQLHYITQTLEDNKAAIRKELLGDA
jgi:hypothetical protein